MYYVNKNVRFMELITKALNNYFGDKVIGVRKGDKIEVKVKNGFPGIMKSLTEKEMDDGFCGGGVIEGLDGEYFVLKLE